MLEASESQMAEAHNFVETSDDQMAAEQPTELASSIPTSATPLLARDACGSDPGQGGEASHASPASRRIPAYWLGVGLVMLLLLAAITIKERVA